jgi:cysteine desulfurase
MNDRVYLDWNATAPALEVTREAMIAALTGAPGNASSIHREGQRARSIVERARRAVARAVSVPPQSVVLNGGATEGNNHVLVTHARHTPGARILCAATEHASVLEVVEALGREEAARVGTIPVDGAGRLDMEWLERELDADPPTLVSVMAANNETGNVNPVARVRELTAARGVALHVDATQALGRIPLDLGELGADYATLSFHKMGGPKGIGAVVLREGVVLEAMMSGGHQERGRRPGTENVVAAAGLEAACRALTRQGPAWREALAERRAVLLGGLGELGEALELRGDLAAQLPNTLNVAVRGVDGEDLLLALDLAGVGASSGSACTAGSLEPSHVLLAMGFGREDAKRSVRLSFGPTTERDALERAARAFVAHARRLSSPR